MPKIDPILGDITVQQLALVEDQLTNNEDSPDEELLALFIESGMTEAQGKQALTYRTRYRLNMYLSGSTPILAGDDAYRFNPHAGAYEREGKDASPLPKPPPKSKRKR